MRIIKKINFKSIAIHILLFTIIIFPLNHVSIIAQSEPVQLATIKNKFLVNTKINQDNWSIEDVWRTISYSPDLLQNLASLPPPSIAIIDSGINKTLFPEQNFPEELAGWDFVEEHEIIEDSNEFTDHGTFIANLIIQMVPTIRIMDIRVLNKDNRNPDYMDFFSAIEYVLQFPEIKVIQFSTEFISSFQNPIPESLHWVFTKAYLQNVTIVSVTGNLEKTTISPPGQWLETIAVSAVENSFGNWTRISYANTGKNIDIVAPGKNIPSINKLGKPIRLSGTSFASAIVGSAVALMLQTNPSLSPTDIRDFLHQNSNYLGDCLEYGTGFLNVSRSLSAVKNNTNFNNNNEFNYKNCFENSSIPQTLPPIPNVETNLSVFTPGENLLFVSFLLYLYKKKKQK